MRSLSLVHIIAGLSPIHGGPSYCVPQLCDALHELDVAARLLTVEEPDTPDAANIRAYPNDFARVPLLGGLRISAGLAAAACAAALKADAIHVHGLWRMPNVYAGRAAARTGRPLVVSSHGMLSPGALAYSRQRKRLFWWLLQGPACARVTCWHATSRQEADELRGFGIRAPIAVIANGVDFSTGPRPAPRPGASRTLLFLGRLHPKKGLDRLLEAWALVAPECPEWQLRIVGPDEGGHRARMEARLRQLAAPRVRFEGPLFGAEKDAAMSNADLFVLPTRSENFGLAVAEALGAGVPAIVTTAAPWEGLRREACGWWIDQGVGPLAEALRAATALPDSELRAMGERGRAWARREFAWQGVAEKTVELYRWVAGAAERPCFVQTD